MTPQLSFEVVGGVAKVANPISVYQPPEEVRDITYEWQKDEQIGDTNLHQSCEELNGMSIIEADNEYQRNWLSWSPPPSNDPEEDWRWTGTRPITRNKIISTAAHLTQKLNAPSVFAQNDSDEEDQIWGEVAELLLEYNIRRSDYEESFLYGVISGLVNVLSYFTVDYVEAKQSVWTGGKEPSLMTDDETSGFQYGLAPADEMLFDNLWEFKWQKQRFRARRKKISFEESQSIYGEHENASYLQPGICAVLGEDGVFYDVEDYSGNMVTESRWMRRRADSEVPFVNGIYLGNANTAYNPFIHRTNKNKPKYPEAKYGAEPIDAKRFIGYKSLAAKMMNDQELADRQWQMAMDASFIGTFSPVIITGTGKVDVSVMAPSAVTSIEADAKVNELGKGANASQAFNALHEVERSMNESSPDPQLAGRNSEGGDPNTARQSLLIQQNAETNLGLMGRMILGTMLPEIGGLMLDDIIRHQTIGDVSEIIAGVPRMKFPTFIVDNKQKDGETKNHIVRFTDRFAGSEMTEEEEDLENLKLLEEAGENKVLHDVNPGLFARFDFLVTIDYQEMMRRNTPFERAFKLSVYDKAIADPNVARDPEASLAVTRDFLFQPVVGGNASKYLPKRPMAEELMPEGMPMDPNDPSAGAQGQGGGTGQDIPTRFMRSSAMESAGGKM